MKTIAKERMAAAPVEQIQVGDIIHDPEQALDGIVEVIVDDLLIYEIFTADGEREVMAGNVKACKLLRRPALAVNDLSRSIGGVAKILLDYSRASDDLANKIVSLVNEGGAGIDTSDAKNIVENLREASNDLWNLAASVREPGNLAIANDEDDADAEQAEQTAEMAAA